MSRIGFRPVPVPAAVSDVTIDGNIVTVTGPKGVLSHEVPAPLTIERNDDGAIVVRRPDDEQDNRALHGLTRTLVNNIVLGVTEGYEKKLEIVGTGYRVTAKGTDLEFALGFSHPVTVKSPEGVTLNVESPSKFSVSGIDKQRVGQVAAKIRGIRPPEPYKGKGVRYADETVVRKAGKAGK
ncbi:50S ribosomal protein L6 [Brachybacterium sacelli]|uniref:Large ribosomal subunit protein uL6 n=1 Tax=Brachybacterium sacelli TaxID=173364 RepID=A0ABS4X411_9MICO|nr:50S ribosomal protein L6 [Brachybacterium sacelli]MBP2383205.1 large subunit ribosomal protein L6 [Brachybacterium sacelli]